jgi:hypothetical protein
VKLYEVPNKSHVKIVGDENGEVFLFDHPDGMYSVCFDKAGTLVHIYIMQEVEIVKGF